MRRAISKYCRNCRSVTVLNAGNLLRYYISSIWTCTNCRQEHEEDTSDTEIEASETEWSDEDSDNE